MALNTARSAGGEAPAPAVPSLASLQALESKTGNELLQALYDEREALTKSLTEWKRSADTIASRRPAFDRAEQLLAHAADNPNATKWADTLAAVRANRSLLDSPDPVAPVAKELGEAMRATVTVAVGAYATAYASGLAALGTDPLWQKLPTAKQTVLLSSAGVQTRSAPSVDSDADLLGALDECSLATWRAHTDALPAQFAKAHAVAVKELEPKARRVSLPPATIRSAADLDAWLAKARTSIELSLKEGPVIL